MDSFIIFVSCNIYITFYFSFTSITNKYFKEFKVLKKNYKKTENLYTIIIYYILPKITQNYFCFNKYLYSILFQLYFS